MTCMLRRYVVLGGVTLLAGSLAYRGEAQSGEATARQSIDAIALEESRAGTGRFTLSVAERRGRFIEGEAVEVMRRRLEAEPAVLAQGTFTYTSGGWLKDLQIAASTGMLPSRTRTAQASGTLRFAVDTLVEGKPQTRALISGVAGTSPGDAVLSHGVARALAGVMWASATTGAAETSLVGSRAMERHTLVVGKSPRIYVRSWELVRSIPGPDGKNVQQTYSCEVTLDSGTGGLARVREWALNPLGGGSAAYRDTTVKQGEPLGAAPSLAVSLPRGALVADARNGSPVEYELLEADAGDTPAPLSTRLQQPAADFELRGTEKKPLKLADFRKKPLLVVWVSAGSPPSVSTAEALDAFHGEYRKKGIQFLALEVSTGADAAKDAEAFRKKSGWSFPIALDPGGALLPQFGLRRAIPAVALVDADGKIVYGRAGLDPTTLSAALDVVKK